MSGRRRPVQAGTHSRGDSYPFPHLITFDAERDLIGEMREFGHHLPKPERSRSATIPAGISRGRVRPSGSTP